MSHPEFSNPDLPDRRPVENGDNPSGQSAGRPRNTAETVLLRQTLRTFDRLLARGVLKKLSPEALGEVLRTQARFHDAARRQQASLPPDPLDESAFLVAAGCRLSSDLNEALTGRLIDMIQDHDEAIAELSKALTTRLRERDEAVRLLREAQHLKQNALETAEAAGLGMVL